MDKYFIVFRINFHTPSGHALGMRMDVNDNAYHIKGFATKSALVKWIDEQKDAFDGYQMLKPID